MYIRFNRRGEVCGTEVTYLATLEDAEKMDQRQRSSGLSGSDIFFVRDSGSPSEFIVTAVNSSRAAAVLHEGCHSPSDPLNPPISPR